MSFFAVAHATADPQFVIDRCHINLFVLRRFGLYDFIWDVGLLVTPVDGAPRDVEFELALPFGTEDESFEDLSAKVLDQRIATQIFGERVVVDDKRLRVPSYGEPFTAVAVRQEGAERFAKSSNGTRSLWKIASRLASEGKSYMRLRFRVLRPSGLWQWQPNAVIRNIAFVDLRVSDIRGADSEDFYRLSDRIVPVPYLNAFVIAPADLTIVSAYPTIKYARLIERVPWQRYLDRDLSSQLAVFHWKEKEKLIDRDNPFRGFLELRPGAQSFSTSDLVRLSVAATLMVTAAGFLAGVPNAVEPFLRESLAWGYQWITGSTVALLVLFVARVQWFVGFLAAGRTRWRERSWRRKR